MDANALIKAAEDSRAVSYAFVSATALICFDICAVLSREVTHVWRTKWSGSKLFYLLVRYHGAFVIFISCAVHTRLQTSLLVSTLRPSLFEDMLRTDGIRGVVIQLCKKWFWFNFVFGGTTLLTVIINGVLISQLYNLYDRNDRVLFSLSLLLSASCMASMVAITNSATWMVSQAYLSPSGASIYGCLAHPPLTKGWLVLWWLAPLFVTGVLLVLFVIKTHVNLTILYEDNTLSMWSALRVFWDDGTCTALLIFFVLISGMTIVIRFEGPLRTLYIPLVSTALTILGSRLILHARERQSNNSSNLPITDSDSLTRFPNPIPRRSSHTPLR